jgi:hypothetical protein
MPKVKIILDPDESIEEAKELLAKALSLDNAIDGKEAYADQLAEDSLSQLNDDVKSLYEKMFAELGAVLAKDVFKI